MVKKMTLRYDTEGEFLKSIDELKPILNKKSNSKVIKQCVNHYKTMIDTIKHLNRKIENIEKEQAHVKKIVTEKQRADMRFNMLFN